MLIVLDKCLKLWDNAAMKIPEWHHHHKQSCTLGKASWDIARLIELMDGRHRIMRALLDGAETIKAVRFDENPSACSVRVACVKGE